MAPPDNMSASSFSKPKSRNDRTKTKHKQKNTRRVRRKNDKLCFSWRLWWRSKYDEWSSSFFLAPCLAIVFAIFLASGLVTLDKYLTSEGVEFPIVMATTVESARQVLGTVAAATISFAGTAFSVSLLLIQLGSSQLSPRVTNTLFRDRFNKNVMALVVGTFTYCLVVLRSVRQELDDTDVAIVPTLSVWLAVLLGILAILATVAFIDHSAHTMDVSQLLERVTQETIYHIRENWVERDAATTVQVEFGPNGEITARAIANENLGETSSSWNSTEKGKSHVVRFRNSGWVQEIDIDAVIRMVPAEGMIQLHVTEGRYAIPGVAVCTIYGLVEELSDDDLLMELEDDILSTIQLGLSRSMRKDPCYGLRQLVDVTLRALSPGVNDPTTAQDGIFHSAAVAIEFLKRNPPPHTYVTPDGGRLILGEQQDHDGVIRLAYEEARKCAASSPTVCVYLMESLRLIRESLRAEGLESRAPEIERQARLIEEGCLLTIQVKDDHLFIMQARKDRFSDVELMSSVYRKIPRKDDLRSDSE